jgi:hypothetical protein
MFRRVVGLSVWVTALAACSSSDNIVPIVQPASIEIAAGNNQSTPANARLPEPLVVRVRDEAGAVLGRVTIEWSISPVGGSLSSSVSVTDVDGEARIDAVLGPVGEYSIVARVTSTPALAQSFIATASDPPALTSLAPSTFVSGDTVVASGTNLSGGAVEVSVGSVVGRVVVSTATAITFVAPSCMPSGPQPVLALIGSTPTNTLTATVQPSSAPLDLAVGQYVSIDPAATGDCAQFGSPGSAEEYLIVPQATTKLIGLVNSFRVGGSAIPLAMTAAPMAPTRLEPTFAQTFHDRVRALERDRAGAGAGAAPIGEPQLFARQTALAAVPTVGSPRTFQVCGSVDDCEPFQTVTATARYVGQRVAIYLDDDVPAGGLTDADITDLGVTFDTRLYPEASRAFGSESDIDANGVVIVLMTDAVNELTPSNQCGESFISGFFFGLDLLPNRENSNGGEIFYSFVADPDGTVSCAHSVNRVRLVTPGTFIHELQHMISWNQRVTLRGSFEEVWIEEGLSHFAEELAGRTYLAEGDTATFSTFAINNLVFAYRYFVSSTSFFLLAPDSVAVTSEYRGASWNFVRWLADQFGSDVTRRLIETGLTGGTNVEAATGVPFSRLLAEWGLTMWVDDLPGFAPPPRLRFTSWDFRTTYGALHEQSPSLIDRPYPIEPPMETDGRTLVRTGTLRAGSPDYVLLDLPAGAPAFELAFTDASLLPLPAALVPRLTVLRIR